MRATSTARRRPSLPAQRANLPRWDGSPVPHAGDDGASGAADHRTVSPQRRAARRRTGGFPVLRSFAPARAAAFAFAVVLVFTAGAGAADRSAPLRFSSIPKNVVQGSTAGVTVAVHPSGVRCSLAVRYANGDRQPDLAPTLALAGAAHWSWQ